MLQVRYGTNLAPEIKENKIDIIKNEPFTTWDAGIINIQKQKYYLLVEKDTSFPILLTKLDAKLFNDGIDVIAVNSLAFKRYCDIAILVNKEITIVTR